ncbi:hypothetical protein [Glycocaulis sp.]|uniref:hypothetical protein n=1 Tax=Glycocaulis sp. TaxID=1969725 RepID=UPI003F71700A
MARLKRDYYKQKLHRLLSCSDDQGIFWLLATVTAALNGVAAAQEKLVGFPEEALGVKIGSPHYIPPWIIETIANELLSIEKNPTGFSRNRSLIYNNFYLARRLERLVVSLENAEDGIFLQSNDVISELHRITQRQFPWQRGFLNASTIYRSAFIYGGAESSSYFENNYDITLSDFVKIGFLLHSQLSKSCSLDRKIDLSPAGVSEESKYLALKLYALPHQSARVQAKLIQSENRHTAYKQSIFRRYPIISFGSNEERLLSPLPELIALRFTDGIYNDIVAGGPKVWDEIGRRFETYCFDYFREMLSPNPVRRELDFGPKGRRKASPDLIVYKNDEAILLIECKAKRQSFDAMFSEDPVSKAEQGYSEIAKGIFQNWRFISACRRGLKDTARLASDCIGIVVTMDPWLTFAPNQEAQMLSIAHKLANDAGDIEQCDRVPVPVIYIGDVEFALRNSDPSTFFQTLRDMIAKENRFGWVLPQSDLKASGQVKPYPFKDRMVEVLPWLAEFPSSKDSAGEKSG